MEEKTSALNPACRALAAGVVLSLCSVFLLATGAGAAETRTYTGSVQPQNGRHDVIQVSVEDPSTITATLKWQKPKAQLKLQLRRPTGTVAASKTGGAKPKSFNRSVNVPGTWRIVVKAAKASSPYNLKVTVTSQGSPPPPPPPPPPAESCEGGVAVSPEMDAQALIDANPQGTTFCFESGMYSLTEPLVPKSYDTLVGAPGTVLDGGNSATGAIYGTGGETGNRGVTVRGFIAQHFASSLTDPWRSAAIKAGWDWLVANNEVRYNRSEGIRANRGVVVRGNYVHHNGKYGVVGYAADGMLWEGNEIAFNNTGDYSFGDAGATKICKSKDVVLRDNYVHDNNGNGLWADTDNVNFIYEGNRVEDNVGVGILHEVSYDAVIRDNIVRYNAASALGQSIGYGSNIQVSVSQNVDIYGNTVEANTNGIGLHDIDRGSGAYGEFELRNVSVHDNVVRMKGTAETGLTGRPEAYSLAASNRFWSNSYYVTESSGKFWFWESSRSWSQWQDENQDVNGSVSVWSG